MVYCKKSAKKDIITMHGKAQSLSKSYHYLTSDDKEDKIIDWKEDYYIAE